MPEQLCCAGVRPVLWHSRHAARIDWLSPATETCLHKMDEEFCAALSYPECELSKYFRYLFLKSRFHLFVVKGHRRKERLLLKMYYFL